MDWLDSQMAKVAVAACDQRQAASLRETDFPVPPGIRQEIPNRFPTTNDAGEPTAIDNKIRVLQALDASGDPIFTMMNLADHNQDIGHSDTFEESHSVSGDWPGYFHNRLEQDMVDRYGPGHGGMAMFLVGDNGSMEDPITDPAIPDPPCNGGANGCFAQVQLTGDTLADDVAAELGQGSRPARPGPVDGRRTEFCVPLQNQLFAFLASIGTFGERHLYTDCVDTGTVGNELKTSVAVLDVGPDLQFLVNPGEAFPGLVLGNPYGIEDASCDNLANPPVPTWHASAPFRFQVGLGDDMIGYEKPAWSFWDPAAYLPTDTCATDPHNHHHGLEDESVGPAASNAVAQQLTALLDESPDPTADIRLGRFVKADGSLTDAYTTPDRRGHPRPLPHRRGRGLARRARADDPECNSAPARQRHDRRAPRRPLLRRTAGRCERRLHGLRRRRPARRAERGHPRHAGLRLLGRGQQALLRQRLSGPDREGHARGGPPRPRDRPRRRQEVQAALAPQAPPLSDPQGEAGRRSAGAEPHNRGLAVPPSFWVPDLHAVAEGGEDGRSGLP